jgi:hypothetical protein
MYTSPLRRKNAGKLPALRSDIGAISTGMLDFHMRRWPKILLTDLTIVKKVLYFPIVRGARVGVLPCRRPAICLIVNEVRLVTNTG